MQNPDVTSAVPFFQPIIETANCGVFGYEVLAREDRGGVVRSLGPYFENPEVPDNDKLALDFHVRERAFQAYAASGSTAKLFINVKPSWLYAYKDTYNTLPTLPFLERHQIDPRNIVIEITEEELIGDYSVLGNLLTEYRKAGCMLAIDDFGKGASNVERIAYIKPDIIKIDHSIVRKMDSHHSFYELAKALSSFGAVSGFDLLFEGIETPFQLERCAKTGWCYLQGYIFAQAMPNFETTYKNKALLSDILTVQNNSRIWNTKCRNDVFTEIENTIEYILPLIPKDKNSLSKKDALRSFAEKLPYYCIRCFICDHDGKQISHVFHIGKDKAVTASSESMHCPPNAFFTHGLSVLHGEKQGYLSRTYKNVATKENVATYMYRLTDDTLLCVDIIATALSEYAS